MWQSRRSEIGVLDIGVPQQRITGSGENHAAVRQHVPSLRHARSVCLVFCSTRTIVAPSSLSLRI